MIALVALGATVNGTMPQSAAYLWTKDTSGYTARKRTIGIPRE